MADILIVALLKSHLVTQQDYRYKPTNSTSTTLCTSVSLFHFGSKIINHCKALQVHKEVNLKV